MQGRVVPFQVYCTSAPGEAGFDGVRTIQRERMRWQVSVAKLVVDDLLRSYHEVDARQ